MKGLSKAESLNLLERMGLNTVDRIVLTYPFTTEELFATMDLAFKDHERVSLRTWRKGKVICPFAPNQSRAGLQHFLETNIEKVSIQDEVIFAEGIDPKTSQMCGKIAHMHSDRLLIEYFVGPGTVRDMESMKASDLKRIELPMSIGQIEKDGIHADLIRLSKYFFRKFPHKVLEWSIYPYHIGKKKAHLIFWEAL